MTGSPIKQQKTKGVKRKNMCGIVPQISMPVFWMLFPSLPPCSPSIPSLRWMDGRMLLLLQCRSRSFVAVKLHLWVRGWRFCAQPTPGEGRGGGAGERVSEWSRVRDCEGGVGEKRGGGRGEKVGCINQRRPVRLDAAASHINTATVQHALLLFYKHI